MRCVILGKGCSADLVFELDLRLVNGKLVYLAGLPTLPCASLYPLDLCHPELYVAQLKGLQ